MTIAPTPVQFTTSRIARGSGGAPGGIAVLDRGGFRAPRLRRRRLGPGGLTRRELEVLRLVSGGESNKAVARVLWVTDQTVKFHLSNIYRKLGVSSRAEAADWARDNGVLDTDSVMVVELALR